MPEGDTLFRTATTLSRAIGGKLVRGFRSPLPAVSGPGAALVGQRIVQIEPRGKNLLVCFEDGSALLTHMKMTGSWHIYRPGERWQKSERAARVVIETDDFVAVCFAAPVVELVPAGRLAHHPSLSRLGPDILGGDFEVAAARARLRELPDLPIGEALLRQDALAGIGNVYKSEVLFLCRVDPFVKVAALSDEALDRLIALARDLMSRNLEGLPRTTTRPSPRAFLPRSAARYHVYDRAGDPCPACGAPIHASRAGSEGVAGRVTFFCPACQPPGALGAAGPANSDRRP